MRKKDLEELLQKQLITEQQETQLDAIYSGRLLSVFYETRTLLYLGVLLLSTGVGILIYQNIGEMGHLISLCAIVVLTLASFYYVWLKRAAYTHSRITPPTPYYDYVLLLGCLLIVSIFGYLQFLYAVLDQHLGMISLATALLFFFVSYRFDHIGVLSLALTAFAAFWGVSISTQRWYSYDFFSQDSLYTTGVLFSIPLMVAALFLDKRAIKNHFTFTYMNYGSLIFLISCTTGIFVSEYAWIFVLLQLLGSAAIAYYGYKASSFVFLLYAVVFGWIALTYFMATTVLPAIPESEMLIMYYIMGSCGGFVYFIVKFKHLFTRK